MIHISLSYLHLLVKDNDLNELDNLAIFRQAQNGVLVRMALFALTLNVENKLTQYEQPVTWHTNK